MAEKIDSTETLNSTRFQYGSFGERYPDWPSWLDGSIWEIDIEAELKESVNNFRGSMHYQAKAMGLTLRTQTLTRDGRRYLRLQGLAPIS